MPYASTRAEDALRRRARRMSDAELIRAELASQREEGGTQYDLHQAVMSEMADRRKRRTERYEALGQRICESYARVGVINADLGLCRNCERYQKSDCPFPDAPYAGVMLPFRPIAALRR